MISCSHSFRALSVNVVYVFQVQNRSNQWLHKMGLGQTKIWKKTSIGRVLQNDYTVLFVCLCQETYPKYPKVIVADIAFHIWTCICGTQIFKSFLSLEAGIMLRLSWLKNHWWSSFTFQTVNMDFFLTVFSIWGEIRECKFWTGSWICM